MKNGLKNYKKATTPTPIPAVQVFLIWMHQQKVFVKKLNRIFHYQLQSLITTTLGSDMQSLVDIGAFSRYLFGVYRHSLSEVITRLLADHIIADSDIQYIFHFISSAKKKKDTATTLKNDKKIMADNLHNVFPHKNEKYLNEALRYCNWDYEKTISAILDGTLPESIERWNAEEEKEVKEDNSKKKMKEEKGSPRNTKKCQPKRQLKI